MKIFSYIHRSITDPSFYKLVVNMRLRTALLFIAQLIIISAIFDGWRHTQSLADPIKGLPAILSQMFSGMEIRDGRLNPQRPTPYFPDARYVADLGALLSVDPVPGAVYPDSFLVVDTSEILSNEQMKNIKVVLTAEALVLNVSPLKPRSLPYSIYFPGKDPVQFNPAGIIRMIRENYASIFIINFFQHAFSMLFNILFSVFFLAFAAFIFSNQRRMRYKQYIVMACFASSPLPILRIFASLAAVRFDWIWQAGIMATTIVMFRAIRALFTDKTRQEQDNDGWQA